MPTCQQLQTEQEAPVGSKPINLAFASLFPTYEMGSTYQN